MRSAECGMRNYGGFLSLKDKNLHLITNQYPNLFINHKEHISTHFPTFL